MTDIVHFEDIDAEQQDILLTAMKNSGMSIEMLTNSEKLVGSQQVSELVRGAVARMQAAPRFFNQEEWNALASYDGHVVSGDPEGPKN